MAREEDLMKQVEELKRKLREAEKEKEEIWRRRKEARGGEYMMSESDAGGIASRAMGSAVHMGQLGIDNNNDRRFLFSQQTATVTNGGGRRQFFFGCCRASGQGDGLCDACGTAGTGRLP